MSQDRRMIFQLLAAGRIDAAQAERLLAAAGADRESLWVLLAGVSLACLAQLRWFAPEVLHLLKGLLGAGLPAVEHALISLPFSWGGLS